MAMFTATMVRLIGACRQVEREGRPPSPLPRSTGADSLGIWQRGDWVALAWTDSRDPVAIIPADYCVRSAQNLRASAIKILLCVALPFSQPSC
eukprot:7751278-Pyramimonas_sp.AAC.1